MENVRGRRPWLPFASTAYAVPHPQVKTLEFRYLGDRSMEQSVVWPDRQQLVTIDTFEWTLKLISSDNDEHHPAPQWRFTDFDTVHKCSDLPCLPERLEDSNINKNLAIANRSRVSCAYNTSTTVTPWPWNLGFIGNRTIRYIIHDLLILSSYLTLNIIVTLKYRLEVTQGHWKWHRSIDHIRLSIGRPL